MISFTEKNYLSYIKEGKKEKGAMIVMENESILSDRAQKAAEKVKEYFTRRPVGGQIHEKNYYLWEDYKHRCRDYKVKMNPEGMEHILRLTNKINAVFFPIAKASGLGPTLFTEQRIDKLLEAVKTNKDWIKETNQLHSDIINEIDKTLVVQIKKK